MCNLIISINVAIHSLSRHSSLWCYLQFVDILHLPKVPIYICVHFAFFIICAIFFCLLKLIYLFCTIHICYLEIIREIYNLTLKQNKMTLKRGPKDLNPGLGGKGGRGPQALKNIYYLG